jgi:iron-sulfur cluster repair protein YtfE (RIC family)
VVRVSLRTEPLRAEHRQLLPRLHELRSVAAGIGASAPSNLQARLDGMVRWLREHLVPHARAEEAVLYPAVEREMGSPGAMATMVADHVEVVRRIDRLAETASALVERPLEPEQLEDLQAQLYGLWAILLLHFDKEENVLLPVLDERLSTGDAEALFTAMAAHADH